MRPGIACASGLCLVVLVVLWECVIPEVSPSAAVLPGYARKEGKKEGLQPGKPGCKAREPLRWFDAQWQHAPDDVKREIDEAVSNNSCAKGFKAHYTALLDPRTRFIPDPLALLLQLRLYLHQFCPKNCDSLLYHPSKTFQGLGSRFHSHVCGLDNGLRIGKPFAPLDGGWIFVNSSTCPESNDHCFFNPTTSCPRRFCSSATDGEQNCARMMPPMSLSSEICGSTCLCGQCGPAEKGQHETLWAKHSCDNFRDIPSSLGLPKGYNRSHLWYTSQLVFFMMQPNEWLQEYLRKDLDDPYFDLPVVNMHIRRGSLKAPEMKRFFSIKEYTDLASLVAERADRYFIQTNEPSVLDDIEKMKIRGLSAAEFRWTAWNRTGKDLQIHNDPRKWKKRAKQGMIVDPDAWTIHSLRNLWLMLRSEYWVCTYSSNWCRLALRLMYATYGTMPPTASLDEWSFDPYGWYTTSYVSNLIQPFNVNMDEKLSCKVIAGTQKEYLDSI